MRDDLPLEHLLEPDANAIQAAKNLIKSDPVSGVRKMQELAEKGSSLAMIELGRSFALGIGVAVDNSIAEMWFRRVADTRSVRGHYFLGRFFLKLHRYAEAKDAYCFASARGYAPALHDLGKMYLLGLGEPKDLAKATQCLEKASNSGNIFAKRLLARVMIQSASNFRAKAKGMALFMEAFVTLIVVMLREGLGSERLLR